MKTDFKQQKFRDHKLIDLLEWLEESTGLEFTETSSIRIGDSGVHGTNPIRAVDLRCRSNEIGIAIEAYINKNWIYDPKRLQMKCCFLHGDESNLHIHLQIHTNTEFIGIKHV